MTSHRSRHIRTAAGAVFLLPLLSAAPAAAATASLGKAGAVPGDQPLPPARSTTFKPRSITFQPRVISVAPAQPAPNTFVAPADVLFDFGSATLSPAAQGDLGNVVNQLKSEKPGPVSITGYTDSIGDPNFNQTLSQQRAQAVQTFLQQNVNNSGLTYTSQGQGQNNPVAPNKTPDGKDNPAGRAQNRRVVITYGTPGPPPPPAGNSG